MQTVSPPPIRPGAVIAWWDGSRLAFGLITRENPPRVRMIVASGAEQRITTGRIAAEVAAPGVVPGATLEERRGAGERVAAVERRVREDAAGIDVELLWEIARETATEGNRAEVDDLADVALGSRHGDARVAVLLALQQDGLHFDRRGDSWLPRQPDAIDELRRQREQAARREEERTAFFTGLRTLMRGGDYEPADDATARRYVAALRQLALHEEETPEPSRSQGLEALKAAKVKSDRPHEGAFRVLRRLGEFEHDDVNLPILRYRLATSFPEEVLEAARAAASAPVFEVDAEDLTALLALSVDSARTTEVDDLLSYEACDTGGGRLGIHIADPARFVAPEDALDTEARARALTHYLPEHKLPMLPEVLSSEAASLLPGEVRPALSFLVDCDANGNVTDWRIVRSQVRSSGRLSYEEAEDLARGTGEQAELLRALDALSLGLRRTRLEAGALLLLAPDVDVWLDDTGQPRVDVAPGDSASRRVVTEAMVLAGALAARFAVQRKLPMLFRTQAQPAELPPLPSDGVRDPVTIRAVRRCLRRAEATVEPGRHASLGLEAYAQVTSPLRRYLDLVCHRQIAAELAGQAPPYSAEDLRQILLASESAEGDARRAERASRDYWILRQMESRVGGSLEATVVEVDPRTIVQLADYLWETPLPSLRGVSPGQRVELWLERVNPRAGRLVLRAV